jgi:hypothetical protein
MGQSVSVKANCQPKAKIEGQRVGDAQKHYTRTHTDTRSLLTHRAEEEDTNNVVTGTRLFKKRIGHIGRVS